jgi:BRCT domain type II-containing protein
VKKEAAKKPAATKAAKPIANKLASKATSTTKTSAAARRQAMIDFDDNYDGEVAMRVEYVGVARSCTFH